MTYFFWQKQKNKASREGLSYLFKKVWRLLWLCKLWLVQLNIIFNFFSSTDEWRSSRACEEPEGCWVKRPYLHQHHWASRWAGTLPGQENGPNRRLRPPGSPSHCHQWIYACWSWKRKEREKMRGDFFWEVWTSGRFACCCIVKPLKIPE